MIVVADTSPLNYLSLIGQIDILPALYGQVVIPTAVREEMLHPSAPLAVRTLAEHPPWWLEVRNAEPARLRLARILGKGKREAIALAQQRRPQIPVTNCSGRT